MNFEEEMSEFETNQHKFKEYELPDSSTITIGDVLIRTPEIMFKPDLVGKDISGIHEQIVNCINKTDLDLRASLYQNITLSGGSTMFPNYQERLQ
jgi:centractin